MIPYENSERRIRDLENRCSEIESLVRNLESRAFMAGMPIFARLWLCSLNEDVGATTAGQAAADLLGLDGTDTGKDVTLTVHSRFADMVSGDEGQCIEQLDIYGARHYTLIQGDCPT